MNSRLLHTHAEDENGDLIHVDDARKGVKYFCTDPECTKEIIFRSSGKTGRGSRRPHFSHKKGTTPNCSPERALHEVFKKKLIDLLEKYKAENRPFMSKWVCNACSYSNSGNLLAKATSKKAECYLGECRPDIALLDKEDNVLAAIEIVFTHKPEQKVLQYYQDKRITLIQINLTSDEDSSRVEEKAKSPDVVDLCLSPKCKNNGRYIMDRRVVGHRTTCSRCRSDILHFKIEIDSVFGKQTSHDFTEDEIGLVKSKYANIVITKDRDTKERYPAMNCLNCQKIRSRFSRNVRF